MNINFPFDEVTTSAKDGQVVILHTHRDHDTFGENSYDVDNFGQILKNLRTAYREAKRQNRIAKRKAKTESTDQD
jgi:hypothetical protein